MKKNILIVAQIPPPFHGQSIMQKYLVDASWPWCNKLHINLDFSDSIDEVGKYSFKKILKIFKIIYKALKVRLKYKIDAVYYPPASPHKTPFYRDVVLLFFLKLISKKIIFHFHAGGIDTLLKKLNNFEKFLAIRTYSSPDLAIVILPRLLQDVQWMHPKNITYVPNGTTDHFGEFPSNENNSPVILFISNIKEGKGIWTLLEAALLLNKRLSFKVKVIGAWHSKKLESEIREFVTKNDLSDKIEFLGSKTGAVKWEIFAGSDIFCHPTYEMESMPVTLIEAMMMAKPIIATDWRAIPDMVDDTVNGFLFPAKDSTALSQKLEVLLKNKELREQMGKAGRKKYLENYTIDIHLSKLENAFKEITE